MPQASKPITLLQIPEILETPAMEDRYTLRDVSFINVFFLRLIANNDCPNRQHSAKMF
jgi:hypothetical protein